MLNISNLTEFHTPSFVEVVKDYHKHLGDKVTQNKVAIILDSIAIHHNNPKIWARNFFNLAAISGVITDDCLKALEIVKRHKQEMAQATQKKVHPMTAEEIDVWLFGSTKAKNDFVSNFFGFDLTASPEEIFNQFKSRK